MNSILIKNIQSCSSKFKRITKNRVLALNSLFLFQHIQIIAFKRYKPLAVF